MLWMGRLGMWNFFSRTPRVCRCILNLRNSDDVATNGTCSFLPVSAADFRDASEFRGGISFYIKTAHPQVMDVPEESKNALMNPAMASWVVASSRCRC